MHNTLRAGTWFIIRRRARECQTDEPVASIQTWGVVSPLL